MKYEPRDFDIVIFNEKVPGHEWLNGHVPVGIVRGKKVCFLSRSRGIWWGITDEETKLHQWVKEIRRPTTDYNLVEVIEGSKYANAYTVVWKPCPVRSRVGCQELEYSKDGIKVAGEKISLKELENMVEYVKVLMKEYVESIS